VDGGMAEEEDNECQELCQKLCKKTSLLYQSLNDYIILFSFQCIYELIVFISKDDINSYEVH
jgi:hypothetical protein